MFLDNDDLEVNVDSMISQSSIEMLPLLLYHQLVGAVFS